MPRRSGARRVVGSIYLGLVTLIVAHITNAFVADALHAPIAPLRQSSSLLASHDGSDSDTSPQRIETILHSGLFELPATLQLAEDGLSVAAPPPPPIEAARKVAMLGSVFGAQGGVMAVLEDVASKKQDLYRLGMDVPNVGLLAAIEKDRVLFRRERSEEWLSLSADQAMRAGAQPVVAPSPPPSTASPARRVLDRREVTSALNDPTRLLTHAQTVPYLSNGKLDGFRLYNVVPLGFFDKLGLQTNDIVQRINGVELRDPGMLLSLFQQLRSERVVRVDLVRDTHRQTLVYDIR